MLSMWEFGMDGGRYDVTEFRNRHLTLPALDDDSVQPESLLSRSPLQINATTKCIIEAHAILECFAGISKDTLQKAPNLIFVRAIYALVVLMKADYAVGTDPEMGEILDSQSLKVDQYLETVHRKTEEAIGPQKCRMPTHWTFVLEQKLMTWRDEYLAWRREGKHLKRRKLNDESARDAGAASATRSPTTVGDTLPTAQLDKRPHALDKQDLTRQLSQPSQQPTPQPTSSTFNNNITHPFAWTPTPEQQQAFAPDMGDFFQNGDLYLWNDVDQNFGGWIPQGGSLYTEFGPFNGQGY
jgi:hypothetical protein